jgi:hypothetical protein
VSLSPGTLRAPGSDDPDESLFKHEARRNGKVVASLRGIWRPDGGVIVEANVTPVGHSPDNAVARPLGFASAEQASRFGHDPLLALEYLDCEIAE